jgi:hypothetical protein
VNPGRSKLRFCSALQESGALRARLLSSSVARLSTRRMESSLLHGRRHEIGMESPAHYGIATRHCLSDHAARRGTGHDDLHPRKSKYGYSAERKREPEPPPELATRPRVLDCHEAPAAPRGRPRGGRHVSCRGATALSRWSTRCAQAEPVTDARRAGVRDGPRGTRRSHGGSPTRSRSRRARSCRPRPVAARSVRDRS